MKKIYEYIIHPSYFLLGLDRRKIIKLSDEKYLKLCFKEQTNKKLNLNNPATFNEKIQWLKINDRKDIYTKMVDKYLAKKYVADIIGDEYIIPTLGIYDCFDEINFDELPNEFVLKPTHTSGDIYICKNKNEIDYKWLKKECNRWLKRDYYRIWREWPYKNIKPRLIIEKYMGDNLKDYKVQCFNDNIDSIFVCDGRNTKSGVKYYYFDKNWNYLNYCGYENLNKEYLNSLKPNKLKEMLNLSKLLSKNMIQIRVDFYEINNRIYFGELTFYTSAGFDTTITLEADIEMGNRLIIK